MFTTGCELTQEQSDAFVKDLDKLKRKYAISVAKLIVSLPKKHRQVAYLLAGEVQMFLVFEVIGCMILENKGK